VDVADDQDRQLAGRHVSMLVGKHWAGWRGWVNFRRRIGA
jgi:hypothetical protein